MRERGDRRAREAEAGYARTEGHGRREERWEEGRKGRRKGGR